MADVHLDVADVSREHVRLRWNKQAATYEVLALASSNHAYLLPDGKETASALQALPPKVWTLWNVHDVLILGSAFLSLEVGQCAPAEIRPSRTGGGDSSAPISNGSDQAEANRPLKPVPEATMLLTAEQLREAEEATSRKSAPAS